MGDLASFLAFGNLILSSAIVITTFSLLIYVLTHNLRSGVARSFCALLAFVLVVYIGDLVIPKVNTLEAAIPWLRFQWLGIAFVPAAYLHFSDSLLRMTNSLSHLRRKAVIGGYLFSAFLFFLAITSDLLVRGGFQKTHLIYLAPGPLFWIFAVYFFIIVAGGAINIQRTRRRCLTSTSKRRMTYLAVAFAAPGLGVFPYLLIASIASYSTPELILFISFVGNIGVALMIIVMAYSVAYFGVLTPDRVVKHSFIHYLLRGPFVATCVIAVMLTIPKVEHVLGLPREMMLVFSVVGFIVLLQIFINLAKPFIDRLIYRQDREEITWIQELDKRLLTTTDLKQFLENLLTAICDLLRVRTAFVAVMADGKLTAEAFCGDLSAIRAFISEFDIGAVVKIEEGESACSGGLPIRPTKSFIVRDGYWVLPLRTRARDSILGILGIEGRSEGVNLNAEEEEVMAAIISNAETALEDRHLQQEIFSALKRIIPEIDRIQRWRGTVRYAGSPALEVIDDSPLLSSDFKNMVKDALSHYWGGPKLTKSPLLKLKVVEKALAENNGNRIKALRSVLNRAIEAMRPEGKRSMTMAEWILYNILDLKFLQGRKVSEIASKLAMSESDLYRKQRVAIEEVTNVIAEMEREAIKQDLSKEQVN
jgi:hypothetical protein